MSPKYEPRTWECPKCGERRTERFAKEVMHNCKTAKRMVVFKEVKSEN